MSGCQIGIDGGGTACRVAVIRNGLRQDLKLGPANVHSDPAGTMDVLRRGLALAGDLHGATIHAGLAGVLGDADADAIRGQFPGMRIAVTDDRPTTMIGALGPGEDGAVLAIGTGSFAGRRSDGVSRFVGGWGLMLGDESSGAWLGRGLLTAALQASDGLGPHSGLTRAVLAEFGDATGVIRFAQGARPEELATFAPRIAAAGDDCIARGLLSQGTDWLLGALTALGWTSGETLCLTGGLGPVYARELVDRVGATITPAKGTALDGAVWMAEQAAQHG